MSLRVSLILVTVLAYVAIGAAWFVNGSDDDERFTEPPFFYTIASEDLRGIEIETGGQSVGWHFREGTNRWFFDDLNDVPADLFRWGGITTLLGGPRVNRVISDKFDDPALYGLDNPETSITVTLRDGTVRQLVLGDQTPNLENHYARMIGFPQLVLVDSSWGQVLQRLVTEPPVPEWMFELEPDTVREILLFKKNEVVRAYSRDRETGDWTLCDLPVQGDPCTGAQPADAEAVVSELDHIAERPIQGVVALNLLNPSDFELYETDQDSPYMAIRIEHQTRPGVTEVNRISMTIGGVTPDGQSRYLVANETSDVVRVEKAWADRVLELFEGDPLVPS